MKKYNLSAIMKRAWELVKKMGMTISAGLKQAWAEAKTIATKMIDRVITELKELIAEAVDCYDYRISTNLWEKYGRSRTYVKVIETRRNSKHYATYDFGYVDNMDDSYHAGRSDAFGPYDLSGSRRK